MDKEKISNIIFFSIVSGLLILTRGEFILIFIIIILFSIFNKKIKLINLTKIILIVSLVISPLKSLMDDQVNALKNRFAFDFVDRIHSGLPKREKDSILDRFKHGTIKILYIAPLAAA